MIGNAINGVKLIIYRYKSDSMGWEKNFDIISGGDVVPSQPGKILYNNTVNFSCKNTLNHILERWAVKPLYLQLIVEYIPL